MKPLFLLVILTVAACNNSSTVSTETDSSTNKTDTAIGNALIDTPIISIKDTIAAPAVVQPVIVKPPRGIYRLVSPSMTLTINFHRNQTFYSEIEDKKKENVIRTQGTWKPTEGIIWTYKDQIAQGRYKWKGNSLVYIDPRKQKTYPMEKLASAMENKVWRNKGKEGIEFFGVGNEPFWNIEINRQKDVRFQLADSTAPLLFKPDTTVQTADSLVYQSASDSTALKVIIVNQFCSDGMSDYIYDNKVSVLYKNRIYKGCGILYK